MAKKKTSEVILTDFVDGKGNVGDTISVAKGYARHLVRQKLAEHATPENKRKWEKRADEIEERRAAKLAEVRDNLATLDGSTLSFERTVGQNGNFYEAIRGRHVAAKIKEVFGIKVSADSISFGDQNAHGFGTSAGRLNAITRPAAYEEAVSLWDSPKEERWAAEVRLGPDFTATVNINAEAVNQTELNARKAITERIANLGNINIPVASFWTDTMQVDKFDIAIAISDLLQSQGIDERLEAHDISFDAPEMEGRQVIETEGQYAAKVRLGNKTLNVNIFAGQTMGRANELMALSDRSEKIKTGIRRAAAEANRYEW